MIGRLIARALGISQDDLAAVHAAHIAHEPDRILVGRDRDVVGHAKHVFAHLAELVARNEYRSLVALGERNLEVLDVLDLDIGRRDARKILGYDLYPEIRNLFLLDKQDHGVFFLDRLDHLIEMIQVDSDIDRICLQILGIMIHVEILRKHIEVDKRPPIRVHHPQDDFFPAKLETSRLYVVVKELDQDLENVGIVGFAFEKKIIVRRHFIFFLISLNQFEWFFLP